MKSPENTYQCWTCLKPGFEQVCDCRRQFTDILAETETETETESETRGRPAKYVSVEVRRTNVSGFPTSLRLFMLKTC